MSNPIERRLITTIFTEARNRPATQIAFRYSDGLTWHDVSWPEYYSMAEKVAAGLASLGVTGGERLAIVSNSRFQWAVTDMASLGIGCVTVPIYHSSTKTDTEFILNDCGASVAFAEDLSQVKKLKSIKIPAVKHIICFTAVSEPGVISFQELQKLGQDYLKKDPNFYLNACEKVKFPDLATIVYTSGTTGMPKGVVLNHLNIAAECEDIKKVLEIDYRDSTLTFLPFAHIFGRVEMWANIYIGWTMNFAESIDRISDNMQEIKPTFMMAVPRIFEKIYSKILGQVEDGSPAKKAIFKWAVGLGKQVSECKREKRPIPMLLDIQYKVAYKLVFSKLNAKLGGRIRYLVSGGAPLSREIAEFFHAAGILVLEGYGLTETTAAITVNHPGNYKFGSVGLPVGESKIKIAADGEILAGGEKIFREYYKNDEATKESMSGEWFHTGDIGEIDDKGFLIITDRKKDLIKTAGGKMIAPQKLEGMLKTNPFISQAVIFGDKMKYLVALVTLNPDELAKFSKNNQLTEIRAEVLVLDTKIRHFVHEIIREKNSTLASYETIKNFAILPIDFTVEAGDLTPSLKVKRKHLSIKYSQVIQELYQGHG